VSAVTPTSERWLPVVDFEGSYEVSDHGRVRSVDRVVRDRIGRVRTFPGQIRTLTPQPRGHLQVGLWLDNKLHQKLVHHLVLGAFVGPCPPGKEGCHWDDNPANNYPDNLRWGTRSENMLDRDRNGVLYQRHITRCPGGHLLAAPNLVPSSLLRGKRGCLACSRAQSYCCRHPELPRHEVSDAYYEAIMAAS
jgi:hypothetical protein